MPEEPNNRRGLIELTLSPEDQDALCAELMKTPGAAIAQRIIAEMEKRGVVIKKAAAQTFVEKRFANYRDRLQKRSELAQFISANSALGDNTLIADAAGGELAQLLFEFMAEEKDSIDLSTEEGRKAANNLGLVISRLRAGDHRLRLVEDKLAKSEAEKVAALAAVDQLSKPAAKGMTIEARNKLRAELGLKPLEEVAA